MTEENKKFVEISAVAKALADKEKKWQEFWEEHSELYRANDKGDDKKKYVLVEFPYPSGSGLHVGHAFSFTGADVYARFKRMQGFNTMFPMGWDAFGLPTENYAIKMKRKPQEITKENTDMFRSQMKKLAFSFDWSREVNTTDPKYYKWTQWIFIKLFEKGLAYKKEMPINWCPKCKIGLANEEVLQSRTGVSVCERCGTEVSRRNISQWIVKITDYADKLIEGLKETNFIEKVKQAQINWIGKSEGAKIRFKIKDSDQELEVFTTRPDTLFGVTFMVVAPEHSLVSKLVETHHDASLQKDIRDYVINSRKKSDLERTELNKEKTGVFSGLYAINPVNNKEIPIWISDFVLASYGTGAIMSVPAHDERDYAFAKKFGLEINQVLAPIFKATDGQDKVRDDKPTVVRKTAYTFLKHWSEDKYLCLNWKKFGWHSGIIGGVEENESFIEAAKREILEETGYKNFELVKEIGVEMHNNFFAGHKDENRYAIGQGFVFKLIDDERQEIKEEDSKNHDLVWIEEKEMDNFLNLGNINFLWDAYKNNSSCFTGDGVLINSEFLNGLDKKEAIEKMISWLKEKNIGERTANYHLRDWIFSRQHYWGEPIPMINCPKCGWQPVLENQLPIVLPDVEHYEPADDGQSPLSQMTDWVKTTCPKCGGEAARETDTMPNWAGSDWYFLRYCDPDNDTVLASGEKLKYWMPVDVYVGGDEHNTLHLLYSRFIYKFLWDIGAVPKENPEPYYKRLSHGVILGPDNQRMSKSKGNVIVPEDVTSKYGVDVLRMYLMFIGPFDGTMAWNEKTLMGVKRFLDRFELFILNQIKNATDSSDQVKVIINKLIDAVTIDFENFKFNTVIAKMMQASNELVDHRLSIADIKSLIKLIAPIAPYLAEELWASCAKASDDQESVSVHVAQWPETDSKYLIEDKVKIIISVNGKVRGDIEIDSAKQDEKEEIIEMAKKLDKLKPWIEGKTILKEVYVPGRILNLVVS